MEARSFLVRDAMAALAANALSGGEPAALDDLLMMHDHEHDEDLEGIMPVPAGSAWHGQLKEFTRVCRVGFLSDVVVAESPQGPGLNVSASTLDPVTQREVKLQVYWQLEEGAEEPVHMLMTDSASWPAHGGDPRRPELLAGFPQDSRPHILHCINHLHDLADLAMEVAIAKEADMERLLKEGIPDSSAADLVMGQIRAEALEDVLAALNGIARLYTSAFRDEGFRDS